MGADEGLRVLLVEDDDLVRVALQRGLLRFGYRVWTASSAEEALEVCEALGKVDLLISDLLMPGLNGLELARALVGKGAVGKVLFVSGYPDDVVRQGEPLTVTAHCLQKPFTPSELVEKIHTLFEGSGASGGAGR